VHSLDKDRGFIEITSLVEDRLWIADISVIGIVVTGAADLHDFISGVLALGFTVTELGIWDASTITA
jgi:hypothetical protein